MPVPIYTATGWVDDDGSGTVGTDFTAARMNNIESGVAEASHAARSVRLATTNSLNMGLAIVSVDDVDLVNGDRVLLWRQSNPAQNGIYTFQGVSLTRATDFDASAEIRAGQAVFVREGTVNAGRTFICQTDLPTVGTTAIAFAAAGALQAAFEAQTGGADVGVPNDGVDRSVLRADSSPLGTAAIYRTDTVAHKVMVQGNVFFFANADLWILVEAYVRVVRSDGTAFPVDGSRMREHSYGTADDTGRPRSIGLLAEGMVSLPAGGTFHPEMMIRCFPGLGGGVYAQTVGYGQISIHRVG